MITLRPAGERGRANHGWLDTRFTFSFADYYDPRHTGFRSLRVINDDRIAPAGGFPMHPHRDMEIVTYMLDGAIAHEDSMGHRTSIRAGEVQRMTAGSGIYHSEFNPSRENPTRLLQIWIRPRERNLPPSYDQRYYEPEAKRGRLLLIASGDGRDGSMKIEQDVGLYATRLGAGERAQLDLAPGRHAWVQVARGTVRLGGTLLEEGDGAALSEEPRVELEGACDSEVLVFDLN